MVTQQGRLRGHMCDSRQMFHTKNIPDLSLEVTSSVHRPSIGQLILSFKRDGAALLLLNTEQNRHHDNDSNVVARWTAPGPSRSLSDY